MEFKEICDELFENDIIRIEAVGYIRGRSIADTYIIIDEAQNLTPKQVRTIITRASKNCKVILLGDPNQVDNPYLGYRTNGLSVASAKMKGSKKTFQIEMEFSEAERSELSIEVAERMGDKN